MCERDRTCTEGMAEDPGCNGWGVVRASGKRYTKRGKPENRVNGVTHAACNGTGMIACGCVVLGEAELAVLAGVELAAVGDRSDDAWVTETVTAA